MFGGTEFGGDGFASAGDSSEVSRGSASIAAPVTSSARIGSLAAGSASARIG